MCFMLHTKAFDDVLTSENLKFDYLKNEKSFRRETKNIFPCFISPLF